MTTRTRKHQAAIHQRVGTDFEDGLDPRELSGLEDNWLDRLRLERARRRSFDDYEYIQQVAG